MQIARKGEAIKSPVGRSNPTGPAYLSGPLYRFVYVSAVGVKRSADPTSLVENSVNAFCPWLLKQQPGLVFPKTFDEIYPVRTVP